MEEHMARTKMDQLKQSHQDIKLMKSIIKEHCLCKSPLALNNDLAKHFAPGESVISFAAEQMPPFAIARMVQKIYKINKKADG